MTKFVSWEDAVVWLKAQPERRDMTIASYFDDPLIDACVRYRSSAEWKAVRALLPNPQKGDLALDVGAGRGISSYALSKDGWSVIALEPDKSAVVGTGAIRSLIDLEPGLDLRILESAGEAIPFESGAFTVVHCRQVLHHAENLPQLCKEIYRVLQPGGRLITTREHVISREQDLERFLKAHPLHSLYGKENAYTLKQYKAAITASGLTIKRVINPWASDINLYPETKVGIKRLLAQKLKLPIAKVIPDTVIEALGHLQSSPGRLFTFVAERPI